MNPTTGFLRPRLASSTKKLGRILFGAAADLADHDDRLCLRVGQEHFQHLDEVGALDRVAPDADGCGLAQSLVGGLEHGLVGQRAGARQDRRHCRA